MTDAAFTTLIGPDALARQIAARDRAGGDWAIVDCRFDLLRPEWGELAYREGHLPGAVYAHLDRDLSGAVGADSGRHPLPQPQALAERLSRWGIDATVQVVAYDQANGMFASRLWWLLRWLGHSRVAVLDGGLAAWQERGLPVTTELPQRAATTFRARPDTDRIVSTRDVVHWVQQDQLAGGRFALIDARAADRFAGRNETLDPVAGHIPGARNHPFARNLNEHSGFLSPTTLHERWTSVLAGVAPQNVAVMCGSGVTACHDLLALEIAGMPGARLYAGSWSEWIRAPERPIAGPDG